MFHTKLAQMKMHMSNLQPQKLEQFQRLLVVILKFGYSTAAVGTIGDNCSSYVDRAVVNADIKY